MQPPILDGSLLGYWESDLVAVEPHPSADRWRKTMPSDLFEQILVADRRIFVNDSVKVYAVAVAGRHLLWSHRCRCGVGCWFGVAGNTGVATCSVGSSHQTVGLRLRDGRVRWTSSYGANRRSRPAMDGSRVYFFVDEGDAADEVNCDLGLRHRPRYRTRALDLATGKLAWEERLSTTYADLTAANGVLLVDSYVPQAVRATDGQDTWKVDRGPMLPPIDAFEVMHVGLTPTAETMVVPGNRRLERRRIRDGAVVDSYPLPVLSRSMFLNRFGRVWATSGQVVAALRFGLRKPEYLLVWEPGGRRVLRWPGGDPAQASVVDDLLLIGEGSRLNAYSLRAAAK